MTQKASQKRPVQEMTEDEQMAAAMRASMENVSTSVNGHGTMESNGEVEVVDVDAKPAAREPSMVDELLAMVVADEPAKGARLQLRMPDGKRIVRRFAPSDPIRIIYAFVAVRVLLLRTCLNECMILVHSRCVFSFFCR